MKIKIIQFDTRDIESVRLSQEINKKYCEINGYDYEFELFKYNPDDYKDVTEFANDEKTKIFTLINYHKYELIEKNLHNYDYVIIMDADCVFVNPDKKIEEFLDYNHDFFISQDCTPDSIRIFLIATANEYIRYCKENNIPYIKNFYEFSEKRGPVILSWTCMKMLGNVFTNPFGINAGFMIFKNSNIIFDFICDFKKFAKLFFNAQDDQGCIAHLLTTKKYKNIFKILPFKFQGNSNLNHPDFKYDENKNIINHITGGIEEARIRGINLVKNNKWWENIFKI